MYRSITHVTNAVSIKCQKIGKHAYHKFLRPKIMSSDVLFCLINIPKHKDITFIDIIHKKAAVLQTREAQITDSLAFLHDNGCNIALQFWQQSAPI